MQTLRLIAVLAHSDDESLGVGGKLAKYASEGADVFLLTATRGDGGRYRGFRPDDHQHRHRVGHRWYRQGVLTAILQDFSHGKEQVPWNAI